MDRGLLQPISMIAKTMVLDGNKWMIYRLQHREVLNCGVVVVVVHKQTVC
jgi:hypothetical protein